MARKKKRQYENKENVDASQSGASHLTSDKSEGFKEVSFNVLENAVERRNSLFGYRSRDFRNRAIISSDEMLSDKGGNRSIGRLSVIVLCIILALSLLAGVMVYLNNRGFFYKVNHSTPLKEAISEIEYYDWDIMVLNSLLQTSISEARISQANLDKEEYADIKKKLDELSDRIKDISKDFDPSSEDAVYAGYAQQTIEARTMMIDTGLKIYDDAAKSVKLIQETDNMWSNVLKADAALKESDNLVQSTSPDNYLIAKQNSETAVTELTEAKSQVAALASKTNEIDFFVYSNYVAARLESAKYSVLACDALINQNLELIGTMNLAYIEKSNVASDIALSMSTTPGQVLRAGYDLRVRPLVEEFKAARKNAADNDFALRQFLAQD